MESKRILRNRTVLVGACATVVVSLLVYGLSRSSPENKATVFEARRGPLNVTVVEGGSIQALESQESRSEVKGYQGTKILKIVEEGYAVTEEDVKNEKVLVELDSSEIRNKITQQDIQFESTAASLIDAQQAYEIQVNQNLSDVRAAEQKAKFARMDFEKFMGNKAAMEIIGQLDLDVETNTSVTNRPPIQNTNAPKSEVAGVAAPGSGSAGLPPVLIASVALAVQTDPRLAAAQSNTPSSTFAGSGSKEAGPQEPSKTEGSQTNNRTGAIDIDFSKYTTADLLGDGEAKQKIRKLDDDLQVAEKERLLAQSTFEGTKRLFDKEFATRTELDNDELKLQNNKLKVQTAETARALFLNYEFLKTAEETLSKYAEAARELDRARKGAISKLAQAEAKLKSAQGKYSLELRQRQELQEQLEKCSIKAKRQGLVVYGGGNEDGVYYGEERIREGATVRERQALITIPDTTKMSVKVKIHETYIKKIQRGQKAKITVDAFPDKVLTGEVMKVGVLPDSQNRWMNPDLKVYLTTIRVDGAFDWLKPGMSAKVEIMVKRLPEVVYVPIQAVVPEDGKQFCYVLQGGKETRRAIDVGDFTDEFIEIKSGIKEGERICLRVPESPEKNAAPATGEKGKVETPAPASKPLSAG